MSLAHLLASWDWPFRNCRISTASTCFGAFKDAYSHWSMRSCQVFISPSCQRTWVVLLICFCIWTWKADSFRTQLVSPKACGTKRCSPAFAPLILPDPLQCIQELQHFSLCTSIRACSCLRHLPPFPQWVQLESGQGSKQRGLAQPESAEAYW